jgi:hypothetical protein
LPSVARALGAWRSGLTDGLGVPKIRGADFGEGAQA